MVTVSRGTVHDGQGHRRWARRAVQSTVRGLPGRGVSVSACQRVHCPVSQCRIAGHGFGVLGSVMRWQLVMVLRCDATVGGRSSLSTSTGGARAVSGRLGIGASFGRSTAPVACRCQSEAWPDVVIDPRSAAPAAANREAGLAAIEVHPILIPRPDHGCSKTRHCAATADSRPPEREKAVEIKSPCRPSLAWFWFPSSCLPSTCLDKPPGAVTLCNNDDFHKPTQQRPISQNRDPFSRLRLRNQPIAPPQNHIQNGVQPRRPTTGTPPHPLPSTTQLTPPPP